MVLSKEHLNPLSDSETAHSNWISFYKIGGVAALLVVMVGILEIVITFLPGGERVSPDTVTVADWFTMYQNSPFFGLRNLGLLNIFITTLGVPVFFALYGIHRHAHQAYAALAVIIFFIGVAVFLATNTAFPMLSLSSQYAAATTDAQRTLLEASGQTLLAVGESHSPGTFLAFFLSEIAGLLISWVMLRSNRFGKAAAYAGIVGFIVLAVFDICSAFVPAAFDIAILFAMVGGILSMVWYILIARKLFALGRH